MDLDKLVNEETAKEGKPFNYQDATFLISPLGKRYESKVARLTDAFRKLNRGKVGTPEQQREIACEAAYGTILHGWEGVTRGTQPIEFTKENCKAILLKYQGIRNFVMETANDTSCFATVVEVEDDSEPTEGTQPGAAENDNGAGAELKSVPAVDDTAQR